MRNYHTKSHSYYYASLQCLPMPLVLVPAWCAQTIVQIMLISFFGRAVVGASSNAPFLQFDCKCFKINGNHVLVNDAADTAYDDVRGLLHETTKWLTNNTTPPVTDLVVVLVHRLVFLNPPNCRSSTTGAFIKKATTPRSSPPSFSWRRKKNMPVPRGRNSFNLSIVNLCTTLWFQYDLKFLRNRTVAF